MEQEFINWFEVNEKRFSHGQFDEKQIAYSAWLKGQKKYDTLYKIYTVRNLADTCRDPDDIHIVDLCYKYDLQQAKEFAEDYIKKSFFHKETQLQQQKDSTYSAHEKDSTYSAHDFVSYGVTIIIEPFIIS